MQAAFLIHESFIFNLPPQTGSGCICGEDRHEKNKTLLLEERLKKSWNKLSISPSCLPQRIPQVFVAADAIWCSYRVLESRCSQSTLTWHLEIPVFKAIWLLSSWLFLVLRAVRGARVVINFSPIREKKKKNSTSNKSFSWKMTKHIPQTQQQRHRASTTLCQLHQKQPRWSLLQVFWVHLSSRAHWLGLHCSQIQCSLLLNLC